MILTEKLNGLVIKVKLEQITLKKKAKHKLKDILEELDSLNKKTTKSRGPRRKTKT